MKKSATLKHLLLFDKKMMRIVVIVSITLFLSLLSGAEAREKVIVNKCCRLGDYLNQDKVCIAGGGFKKWAPRVFLPLKTSYYNKTGELPNFMVVQEEYVPKTCQDPELFNDPVLIGNGSLFIKAKELFVQPQDFCIDKDVALICREEIAHNLDPESLIEASKVIKINKCCGPNQVYSEAVDKSPCVSLNKSHPLYNFNLLEGARVDLSYVFPECETNDFAFAGLFEKENYNVETGELMTESGKKFQSSQYCLDHVLASDQKGVNIFTCSEHYGKIPVHIEEVEDRRFKIYSIGLFISVLFLLATLAVGFLLLSNHHVLHWRCQTNYVACLLVGDLLLAITQMAGNSITGKFCITIAIFMHFFFLAAFFWLNTMCFNIWWTFRDFRPTSLEKGQEVFRLRIYEIYAWGVPVLITTVAAILDNLPVSPDESFLRPRFGENKCWFYGDLEIFTYFFGPIGLLLCINILLFLSTARQLTCGLWKRDDVKSTTERAALGRVCMKLVIVMGVTWIADVVSWAIGGPHYVWYVTDIINALQGVFIFIVVGCQPQVWSAMKRFWSSQTGRPMTNTTNGPQHSSSSHGLPSMDASVTNNTTSSKVPMETMC